MSADDAPVRVVLVDDQELVRSGLRRILRRRDGFEIVAECADGDEVPATLAGLQLDRGADSPADSPADVVVMDLRMKRVGGIEATAALRAADGPPVLVLTTFDDDELLSAALRAGAAGFVLKDSAAEDLIRSVRAVAGGDSWLDPAVTARVLTAYRATDPAGPARPTRADDVLTAREREVLVAIGRGLTNAEIAASLHISELTVKSHVGRIFTKLDLRDRAAAVVHAFDTGLVRPR